MFVDISHDLAGKLGHDVFGNQCGLVKTGVGQDQELQEIGGGLSLIHIYFITACIVDIS